ncbi:RraA family protein (plasmid) [Azospirillum sp. TSA2s]|uniref:RraA family protein n=1 Tax=Azospirillum sp. TSA2s TaxID=709810 RepID=UPI0010AB4712|nr:RraA family protein [Azospirillum sp. TSA2s]QCG99336.1 RraA family protein [Azospirillum sp. TSA2s]
MTIGFRIERAPSRPSSDLIAAFKTVPTAIVSDNMNRMFAGGAGLRPIHRTGVLCGSALTVRTRPGDNLMVHKALDLARPGDVIVVDAGGDTTNAIIGEIMWSYARTRGVAGFVIDGAVRDTAVLAAGDLPVYARGATHRGPYKDGPGEINVTVSVGGMVVAPGDILLGDEDGLLAVPQADAPAILELARAQQDREGGILRSIADGTVDRSWVDRLLAERGLRS